MVSDSWSNSASIGENIMKFSKDAKVWNQEEFGNISMRKRRLVGRLKGVQRAMDRKPTKNLRKLEVKLNCDLERVLDLEEMLWKQRSRSDWMENGDRNTRYFHRCADARKKRTRIAGLKIISGEWCFDENQLKDEAIHFFPDLYSMEGIDGERLPDYGYFGTLPVAIKEALTSRVTKDEVKAALNSMAPLKAPGKDGLHAKFYQSQWDAVGDSIYKMVLEAFEGKPLNPMINNTVLVLLPKVDKPETLSQY